MGEPKPNSGSRTKKDVSHLTREEIQKRKKNRQINKAETERLAKRREFEKKEDARRAGIDPERRSRSS